MDALIVKASELCGTTGTTIEQDDTFFVTEKGRLKLRVFKVSRYLPPLFIFTFSIHSNLVLFE